MSLAQAFFNMAIDETDGGHLSKYDDVERRAAGAMTGAIGQNLTSDSRDDFIKAGFDYLDCIGDQADTAIANAMIDDQGNDKPDKKLIAAIRELEKQAAGVLLGEYFQLLAADWDERNTA